MSSSAVRTLIKEFLDDNSDEDVVDITGHFEDVREMLSTEDIQPDAPWLALDFIGGDEEPVSLSATNTTGLYRETGRISLHVCAAARLGVGNELVTRAETLRNLFRGARISGIVIDGVGPINTGPGATLEFEAGYVSGTVEIDYTYDFTPA